MELLDQLLHVFQNVLLFLTRVIWRHTPLALSHAHSSPGRVESQPYMSAQCTLAACSSKLIDPVQFWTAVLNACVLCCAAATLNCWLGKPALLQSLRAEL